MTNNNILTMNNYYNDFFDERVFKSSWDKFVDKEIVKNDFSEFLQNSTFTNIIRICCYKKKINYKNLLFLCENKTENYIRNILSKLNKKSELKITKENGLIYYEISEKGIKILSNNVFNFIRENKYIKNQSDYEIDNEIIKPNEIKKAFFDFIQSNYQKEINRLISNDESSLLVSIAEMSMHDYKLSEILLTEPIKMINFFEICLNEYIENKDNSTNHIFLRFVDLPDSDSVRIGQHRKEHINKLISFEGIIRRKSGVKPMLSSIDYLCCNPACNFSKNIIKVKQLDEKVIKLKTCPKCKSSLEIINKNLVDCLLLVLEQDFSERSNDCDSQKVHIKLNNDLTANGYYKKLKISSRVKIIGILKEVKRYTTGGAESINYDFILEANNIIFLEDSEDLTITKKDINEFKEFANKEDCFEILTKCYIPEIYGHEKIKEQLMLQHIGSSFPNSRKDSHILLLGDPSTGKTKLIKESLKYNSRYVYSSGSSSTKAGLTATVIKDELIGTWVLEPGVLPRANGGIAGCDELDKLNKDDTNSLTEALEQQVISFNKANISAELKTECPFLAGANPKYGRFDNEQDIQKQVNFDPVLISRFDLIFIVRDIPDAEKDYNVISHLLNKYEDNIENELLIKYDSEFIKKYLYFCKTTIQPKLTTSSKEKLAKYFAEVRKNENLNNVFGFTIRQMEGVIRVACAYARFHQSKTINLEHINYAFEVFNKSIRELNQRQTIINI